MYVNLNIVKHKKSGHHNTIKSTKQRRWNTSPEHKNKDINVAQVIKKYPFMIKWVFKRTVVDANPCSNYTFYTTKQH